MLRADLIYLSKQEHALLIMLHHVASDRWSVSLIVKEVTELYTAYIDGREPELPHP